MFKYKKLYKKKKTKKSYKLQKIEYDEMEFCSIIEVIIKLFKFFVLIFILFIIIKKKHKKIEEKHQIIQPRKNATKVALCSRVKKENRYVKYFIQHYKNLGYNHLFFGDNNELNDESLLDIKEIQEGIKEGFITVVNRRGIKRQDLGWNYICYENHSLEYDWFSFFDLDEYLILEQNNTLIQDFLDHPRYNKCEQVKINWRIFTDNDQLDFEDKNPIERFPIESNFKKENRHIKSTIRGGLNYKELIRNYNLHSLYDNLKACSSSGKEVEGKLYYNNPPEMENAVINHYVTKSIREFAIKKCRTLGNVETLSNGTKGYIFYYFFLINKKSQEKVDIFKIMIISFYINI